MSSNAVVWIIGILLAVMAAYFRWASINGFWPW